MNSKALDQKMRTALRAGDPAVMALVEYLLRTDASLLDEPMFYVVRRSDRAMRTFCGRWTNYRADAGYWTRAEADHIDKVLLVGSHAVEIIPEGKSPYEVN